MSRQEDLEKDIRDTYQIIHDYERRIETTHDPLERRGAEYKIDEQQKLIQGYLSEYGNLNVALPPDIAQIAARFAPNYPPPAPSPPPRRPRNLRPPDPTPEQPAPESWTAFIPPDRCRAIAQGQLLPERTHGAAMLVDVSGITPLTEALTLEMRDRRGAEELSLHLNDLFTALIARIYRYGGSVISFAGDAITCWFDHDQGERAIACGLALEHEMQPFATRKTRSGANVDLAIKVSITVGPARRFEVGHPDIQKIDVLAGRTLDRMAAAGRLARRNELIIDADLAARWSHSLQVREWRTDSYTGQQFAVFGSWNPPTLPAPGPPISPVTLSREQAALWLLPPVYKWLLTNTAAFMSDLRLVVSMFLSFAGLDYDNDEAAGEKLNVFIGAVQDILCDYHSYILQVIVGDKGSMLYTALGAPDGGDQNAPDALKAALRLAELNTQFQLDIRIGISIGRVYAGVYGSPLRYTYGVLGDEVNVSARLMERASSNQILVSQWMAQAVARDYRCTDGGQVTLKGKSKPMRVYTTPFHPQTRRLEERAIVLAEFLDRQTQVEQMQHILDAVVQGRGQVVRLEGAAGIGKSSLVAQWMQMAGNRHLLRASGFCSGDSIRQSYVPWRKIMRSLLEMPAHIAGTISKSDQDLEQIRHLEKTLADIPGILQRLPLLGDLFDLYIPETLETLNLKPRQRQQQLTNLVIEIVRTRAVRRPLMLVIQDTQWIDEASAWLVGHLSRALSDVGILLVLAHRPCENVLWADLDRLPCDHHILLGELAAQHIAQIVKTRLEGEVDPLALALIQTCAQGNPFFAQELTATLQESQDLICQDSGWSLSPHIINQLCRAGCLQRQRGTWVWNLNMPLAAANLNIPQSVESIVQSRIDRLSPQIRFTLHIAGVIGGSFSFDLLARAHLDHPGPNELLQQMELLQRHGIVRPDISSGRLMYLFQDHITQEVIYDKMLEMQQRQLHGAVGAALEQLDPGAVEQLAWHWGHSHTPQRALVYLEQAALKAQQEYANETALYYYEQALDIEDRWEWRKGQVHMLHILGQRDGELEALQQLEKHPAAPRGETAYLWGLYDEAIGEYGPAQAAIDRAVDAFGEQADTLGQARCLAQGGLIARRQGDYELAQTRYELALTLFSEEDCAAEAAHTRIHILNGLGSVHRQMGNLDQAQQCYQRALSYSQGCNYLLGQAESLNSLGGLSLHRRELSRAMDFYRQSLEIYRRIGDRNREGVGLLNTAQIDLEQGNYDQARQGLQESLSIQEAIGDLWEQVNIWNTWGVWYQELGDLSQAQEALQRGLTLSRQIGDESGQAYLLSNLGMVMRERGDDAAAIRALQEGLHIVQKQGDRQQMALFYSYLAAVYLHHGQPLWAVEMAQSALRRRQELNLRLHITADLATLAAAYQARNQADQSLLHAQQALSILNECQGQGPESPQRDYFVCYQVLQSLGQTQAAWDALKAACNLVSERADRIADAASREAFVSRPPLNRQIMAAFQENLSALIRQDR